MEDTPIFPDPPVVTVERTLAIIKPDAVHRADEVMEDIKSLEFSILNQRRLRLTPEQASDFYAEHYGKMFFPSLIAYMQSADIIALVLAKRDAIQEWRDLLGPTNAVRAKQEAPDSLRAKYGHDQTRNGLHGSDSYHTAEREIRFMFSESITEPIYHGQDATDYLQSKVNPVLTKALTHLSKQKPEDPLTWLAQWLLDNNPNKPKVTEVDP
ncbi:nucleoside diphosphate kinase homolog 5-like [Halichondria panicea]|uniref:nucleoside diphosphate kinase homolog 5-like n=1 Tax=Halichondria panicea TaxID=6063 RepID=UPI00312B4ACF